MHNLYMLNAMAGNLETGIEVEGRPALVRWAICEIQQLRTNIDKLQMIEPSLRMVQEELEWATKKFGPFHSAHEGFAVIKEEYGELWDEVKRKDRDADAMMKEAAQLGAMAVRFIMDLSLGNVTEGR